MKTIMPLAGIVAAAICASGQTYSTGIISNNNFLSLVGPTNSLLYGVNFAGNAQTTVNGYVFSADPLNGGPVPVIYANGINAQVPSFLTQNGGTSGDASLDAVLTTGQVPGPTPQTLVLGGLTPGVTYKALIFNCDTRAGINQDRSISVTHNGLESPLQRYAFEAGVGGVGGYILDTFTAAGTQESITNNQPNGAQINGLLVGSSRVDLQACKLEYSIVSPK